MTQKPINRGMDAVLARTSRIELADDLLLRHCLAIGGTISTRPPVKARLEEALGPELAQRLVSSLTATGRN
jgi:hypothetical protein